MSVLLQHLDAGLGVAAVWDLRSPWARPELNPDLNAVTGMWTKDMKFHSNLQQPQITKILKTLESRKLVKSVKSVTGGNRKVYMLYELEPSRELTGGAW